jgi:NADH:ubiquinone oxidoreductase subunit F (NADH-binding)/NADH:ubiquinone oxidoreductase subunit E
MILPELRRIQEQWGYLPKPALLSLAERLDVPLHKLHEVVTFFPHFRLEPAPPVEMRVCRDMACHLAGSRRCFEAMKALAEEFGVETRSSADDALDRDGSGLSPSFPLSGPLRPRVEVGWVSCLGRCDEAPALLIEFHAMASPHQSRVITAQDLAGLTARVRALLSSHLAGAKLPPESVDRSPLSGSIDPYRAQKVEQAEHEPYAAVRRFATALKQANGDTARTAVGDALIETLKTSDLRGMGGAGRPAFSKWAEVRAESQRGGATYVICNGDESEPSTFKDRELLLRAAHLVIEAMVLGALLVGAHRGYIYVRHEYYQQIQKVKEEISRVRELGVLGDDVLGTGQAFELEVFESPGGYVCGEQSALIEAIEEHRAEPRNRPPAIEANGLHGRPTLLNNVETFAWVPAIVLRGGDWYREAGIQSSDWYASKTKPGVGGRGLRLFSICGDVGRPGVYEVPIGLTLGELIERAGGMRDGLPLLGFAPSGPSGGFVPANLLPGDLPERYQSNFPPGRSQLDIRDLPLDKAEFDALGLMLGAGLLVVAAVPGVDPAVRMFDLALNATRFFRNESCGKCVPCRVGSQKLVQIGESMGNSPRGGAERSRLEAMIGELQSVMEQTSICGLGTSASKPLASSLAYQWNRI